MHSRIVASEAAPSTATTSAPAFAAISTSARPASMIFMSATIVASGNSSRSFLTASRPSLLISGVPASSLRTPPSHASCAARSACERFAKSRASCSCGSAIMPIPPIARPSAQSRRARAADHVGSSAKRSVAPFSDESKISHTRFRTYSVPSPMSPLSRARASASPPAPPHGAQKCTVLRPSPQPHTSISESMRA